ncbi:hypothetical protein GCM10022205_38190 [Spinactinospora alkalitolerans]
MAATLRSVTEGYPPPTIVNPRGQPGPGPSPARGTRRDGFPPTREGEPARADSPLFGSLSHRSARAEAASEAVCS